MAVAIRLIVGLWAALFATASLALPMVSLNPSSTTLSLNEAFTVDVLLSGAAASDPFLAFGFDVDTGAGPQFNGAAVAAPFFDDSGAFFTTDVAGSTLPAVFGDDILLATLSMNAGLLPGTWNIALTSTGGDFGVSEGLFTVAATLGIQADFAVEVIGGTAVPLPSAMCLLVLGLLLLPSYTRR